MEWTKKDEKMTILIFIIIKNAQKSEKE